MPGCCCCTSVTPIAAVFQCTVLSLLSFIAAYRLVPLYTHVSACMALYMLFCSMSGMYYTAEAYSTGMRDLRLRLPDDWMARGNEWVNLPIVYIR